MDQTIVVLVNGEVLANVQGSSIRDQRENARTLADALHPLFASSNKMIVLHGNKPQVGYVLFRSELASHVLHTVPLDVCGADTQGATGYMLTQAFRNVIRRQGSMRKVMCILTQTVVEADLPTDETPTKTIGPWFDREKAELHRQTRGWRMVEERGRGYRRAVSSYPPKEILEFEEIEKLVNDGDIIIAGGGGGIPVRYNAQGELEGIEAVVDTDQVACLMAEKLGAKVMLMVIEKDNKFVLSGLTTERSAHLPLEILNTLLAQGNFPSSTVESKLRAASRFLQSGGEQVIITTLRKLPDTLAGRSGLRIGSPEFQFAVSPL